MVAEPVGHLEPEAEKGRRERLPVIVEREAARDAAAERALGDEVERVDRVDLVARDAALDDARVEGGEALRGELLLEERVELGRVGEDGDVRGVALVAR